MSLSNEIKTLRKNSKLSQLDLAKKLGVSRSAVNMWEQGERKPSIPVLKDMADLFEVDIMVLLGPLLDSETENYIKENKTVKESVQSYTVDADIIPKEGMKSLPIVGQISCGKGGLAFEEIEGYEETPSTWLNGGQYFYLRAKGNSMVNARIHDGDLVLIREQPEVEDGEIAAVLINDEAVLKRVYKRDNALILQSENAEYPPMVVSEGVQIIGKLKKIVINM